MPLKPAELQRRFPPSTVGFGGSGHPRLLKLMIIPLQLLEKEFEVSKGTQVLNIFAGYTSLRLGRRRASVVGSRAATQGFGWSLRRTLQTSCQSDFRIHEQDFAQLSVCRV